MAGLNIHLMMLCVFLGGESGYQKKGKIVLIIQPIFIINGVNIVLDQKQWQNKIFMNFVCVMN